MCALAEKRVAELKEEKKGGQGTDEREEGGKEGKGEGEEEEEERGVGTEELEAREDRDGMDVLEKETLTGFFTHMYMYVYTVYMQLQYNTHVPCLHVLYGTCTCTCTCIAGMTDCVPCKPFLLRPASSFFKSCA